MFDELKEVLQQIHADYADIRYEVKMVTNISYIGNELTKIGSNTSSGYVLRVLKGGGMATVAFASKKDASKAIRAAMENAQLNGQALSKPIRLKSVEVHKDIVIPRLIEDPREISIDEKLELIRRYNAIPLGCEKVASTRFTYEDVVRERYFLSTEGAEIREDLVTSSLKGSITAMVGSQTQNISIHAGGGDGFSALRNIEPYLEERTSIAVDLLMAKPIQGGTYNCILNPNLTGSFAHEAFGHFSEADLIENLPAMRAKMQIGNQLGTEIVNIMDDPTIPGQLGYYHYDDEGVRVRPTQLMKNGVLTGRLHSRRSAAEFDEPVTGHYVAEDFRYMPLVKMGNTFIEPGSSDFSELVERLENGLYLLDVSGGATHGENFTFGAQYGYLIENGKIKEMVRDLSVMGNLYHTLKNIEAVGNDLVFTKVGLCGKGGQMHIRSCNGGPHILVKNLTIGGA